MERIKVLVVDDHPVFRKGLVDILSNSEVLEVVWEASDGNEAVKEARSHFPQVVLMDLFMPNCDGVGATRQLQNEMSEVNILVRGILKGCVNSQAVYPLSEQDGLKAQERRYTAYGKEKH